jgi:type IV pilus assembly protein PilY1
LSTQQLNLPATRPPSAFKAEVNTMLPCLLPGSPTVIRRFAMVLGSVLALLPAMAAAQQDPLVGYEDIDLFAKRPSTADLPNVLLVLDTSANWGASAANACTTYDDGTPGPNQSNPGIEQGKKIAIQKCALVNTLLALPTGPGGVAKFRVGVMYMNAPNTDGAYPRSGFLELTAANKATLTDVLKNTWIDAAGDQGSNADYARALWEAYLWYKGMAPYKGKAQTNASRIKWDGGAFDASGNYDSPAASNCGRNYVIIVSNGSPQGTEADVRDLVQAAGGNVNAIPYSSSYVSSNDANNWADETSRFLRGVDVSSKDDTQNIITYSIAITSASPPPSEVRSNNFIKEIAIQGGGTGFTATNVAELTKALTDIFNQIQAANSVFASASLPVSVNTQGTFLNQVFMGMFRPDADSRPRWMGNLKQYQFGYNAATQKVTLVDANGNNAINPASGFIDPSAKSFWSSATPYTNFWKNKTWGEDEINAGGASDAPDGQLVEKGGAAQRLREQYMTSQSSRPVYTCFACGAGTLTDFNNTNVTQAMLGAADTAERDALINWTRGTDNMPPSDERGPGTVTSTGTPSTVTATVRPGIHGDVIHSSPAVVNYGSSGAGVIVFYGDNGGMLHAVRGARTGSTAGQELWSFIPPEFLPKLKRLRDNTTKVQFAATDMTTLPTPQRKDYAMDGPLTFYQKNGSGAKVHLYAGMRRGGRALYAFNVTTPSSPSLLWKIDNNSTGLGALGQTWSEARVTRIKGIDDPVIIMGGGYDPTEDSSTPGTPTMGNIVVVLNSRTGDVLRVFTGLSRPVPASVSIVDSDGDGQMDRAYAVDLGGSVYRILFPSATAADWVMTKIADFSTSSASGQKMFYAPAVTPTTFGGATVYAVQVGTGDREKPLKASGTEDRYFTVLDRGQSSPVGIDALVSMTTDGLASIPNDKYGCYLNMPNAGEKVVNAVTYTSGYAFFGTNSPAPPSNNSCTGPLGTARTYAVPALCGPTKVSVLEGGGLPPTAVTGTVLIAPDPVNGVQVDCETNPEACRRVPVGIGIMPPDCQGNVSTVTSSIGASNIYACAPPQRLRRDWSIPRPR